MLHNAALILFFIFFLLLTFVAPIQGQELSPESASAVLRVPLSKRSLLVNEQSVVDVSLLRAHRLQVDSKISRGLRAYQKNQADTHLNSLSLTHQVAVRGDSKSSITSSITSKGSGSGSGSGGTPLEFQQNLWQGTIAVGTPPQNFTVDIDTGSSDFFLPGIGCSKFCERHNRYDAGASSTSALTNVSFTLNYGDGSKVTGTQCKDTVTLAGLTVTSQTLGVADTYSTGFSIKEFTPDGLIGMGFPEISVLKTTSFFQNLVDQKQTSKPQFAFKLDDKKSGNSEMSLGGVNPELYKGNFTMLNVNKVGFWEVALDAINVNGSVAMGKVAAIIDTGTTFILGGYDEVADFYKFIPGAAIAKKSNGDGYHTVPCNSTLNISLTFGGIVFPIPKSNFILGKVSPGSKDCIGGIAGADLTDFWVVGDMFLQTVYTMFDIEAKQVGFATLA